MQPNIQRPPGDDWPGELTSEQQDFVLSRWHQTPAAIREEIVTLWNAGWRWKMQDGRTCLTDPDNDEMWIYIHPITFARILSVKRAWQVEEEAGRGWWSDAQ